MVDSCINCEQCEDACPVDIPPFLKLVMKLITG
ncbi:MAG: 4Fe-4S binding protein [Methanobacterium sp.]